jgi:hypothetical protein
VPRSALNDPVAQFEISRRTHQQIGGDRKDILPQVSARVVDCRLSCCCIAGLQVRIGVIVGANDGYRQVSGFLEQTVNLRLWSEAHGSILSRKGSQISFFAELADSPSSWRAAVLVVSAAKSNGCRKIATTSPFSQRSSKVRN